MLEAALADLTSGAKDFATLASRAQRRSRQQGKRRRSRLDDTRAPAGISRSRCFPSPCTSPRCCAPASAGIWWKSPAASPPSHATFDEAKPEVIAALEAVKRRQAAAEFRDALRRFEADKIDVYHDMMAD
jgi:hypothetical protein